MPGFELEVPGIRTTQDGASGTGQWITTPTGRIGINTRENGFGIQIDDTGSTEGTGVRLTRDGAKLWDLDIDGNGDLFLDDISVQPSMPAIVCRLGQLSTGIDVHPTEVLVQRQLTLTDLSTGAVGVRQQYVAGTGHSFYDATQAGPPEILRMALGAAGKFTFAPGTGGVEISGAAENSTGLRFTNTNASKTWRVGAIETGISHARFTLRDVTNSRDVLRADENGGISLYIPALAAIKEVEVGAADSGGAGYRMLRVAN